MLQISAKDQIRKVQKRIKNKKNVEQIYFKKIYSVSLAFVSNGL